MHRQAAEEEKRIDKLRKEEEDKIKREEKAKEEETTRLQRIWSKGGREVNYSIRYNRLLITQLFFYCKTTIQS